MSGYAPLADVATLASGLLPNLGPPEGGFPAPSRRRAGCAVVVEQHIGAKLPIEPCGRFSL